MRRKGAVTLLTNFALLIILLAIGVYLVFGPLKNMALDVVRTIGEHLGIDINDDENPEIIAAIRCSHYRCKEGCNLTESKNIEKLSWEDTGKKVYCKDFCDPELLDLLGIEHPDLKVCGEDSDNYPVEFNNPEDVTITHSQLKEFTCILPRKNFKENKVIFLDIAWDKPVVGKGVNFVSIDKNVEGSGEKEEEKCITPSVSRISEALSRLATDEAYKKVSLKKGRIYLYSSVEIPSLSAPNYTTFVSSKLEYIILEPNQEIQVEFKGYRESNYANMPPIVKRIVLQKDFDEFNARISVDENYGLGGQTFDLLDIEVVCFNGEVDKRQLIKNPSGETKEIWCDNTLEIKRDNFDQYGNDINIVLSLKYIDPDCYSEYFYLDCSQNSGCQTCLLPKRENLIEPEERFEKCCYNFEDCYDCSAEQPSQYNCNGRTIDQCKGFCEVCEPIINLAYNTWSCCLQDLCNINGKCKERQCGDECLGNEDSGCPDECPCAFDSTYGKYYCSKGQCPKPNVCVYGYYGCNPPRQVLFGFTCDQFNYVCCTPPPPITINPNFIPLVALGDSKITIKVEATTAYTNVALKMRKGTSGTWVSKGSPNPIVTDPCCSWTWYANVNPTPEEQAKNVFKLEGSGTYYIQFWAEDKLVYDENKNYLVVT